MTLRAAKTIAILAYAAYFAATLADSLRTPATTVAPGIVR